METNNKLEKSELQLRLETQTPVFLKKYKTMILEVIEDYIYIPDFLGRNDYIYESFEKNLKDLNIQDNIVLDEINSIKNIVRDIADGKYFQKLELI